MEILRKKIRDMTLVQAELHRENKLLSNENIEIKEDN
jgi:hypothetical protein